MKHGPKGNQAIKKAEQSGENIEIYKKAEHANKNNYDPKHVAKILNAE
jgi:translation initiation factor 2 beta subunit (eIF-2beta)/eIF-5